MCDNDLCRLHLPLHEDVFATLQVHIVDEQMWPWNLVLQSVSPLASLQISATL